jgi:hypothetical protein
MTDRHDRARFGQQQCHPRPGAEAVSGPLGEKAMATREMTMGTAELLTKQYFTKDQARAIATELEIDFRALGCDLEQFRMGLGVELEHGPRNAMTDVSGDDRLVTGKIALAHLTEFPDYYTRLAVLEREAADHKSRKK